MFFSEKQKVIKSVTDGDIRRALINGFKLDDKLLKIGNKKFKFLDIDKKINLKNKDKLREVKVLPILDKRFVNKYLLLMN